MNNPLISIIIPTYNRAHLIRETLDSIIAQTYINWECIIVDDGSSDNTFEVIQAYTAYDSRFRYFERPEERPKGGNACRNFGFEKSAGEFVNWFDSDDIMLPLFLEKKIKVLIINKSDAVISRLCFFSNSCNDCKAENRPNFSSDLLTDFLTLKITWYLPDVMWQAAYLKNKKLFCESLLAGQDRDFHSRMLLFNPKIEAISDVLTCYRMHEKNLTKNITVEAEILMKISHLHGVEGLLKDVKKFDKLNNSIKLHYFKVVTRYYPFVNDNIIEKERMYNLLQILYFFNFTVFLWILKLNVARIFYRFTGKGAVFLR